MLRRFRPALAAAIATTILSVGVAAGATGGTKLINSPMVGIPTAGLVLDGVIGGGLPWVLDEGHAQLRADGRLDIEVEGLVLAAGALAGTNPIERGVGIVTCSDGATTLTTQSVPFSRPTGNAEIHTRVNLPSTCLAPAVFFAGVTAAGNRWFAVNGG